MNEEIIQGTPWPLGASWREEEQAYNFALYSKDATAVSLLLYGDQDFVHPLDTIPFAFPANKTGRVWHARVRPAAAVRYYAYRVDGPFTPGSGDRFDSDKVLLDPYATGVVFPPNFSRNAAAQPGSNAGQAPLGVLPPRQAAPVNRPAGPRHGGDLVIYEMHVKGFTRRPNSGVPEAARGTFAGVIAKIPYLVDLGITAVELMPIHQFDPQEGNYWGYMTLSFFSPHVQYGSDGTAEGALAEFQRMVDEFHRAGIEVFLDVVYNHTTEQGVGGPTYSMRGIDNASYYALDPGNLANYTNFSGCGNDLRTEHPIVRRLVVDSLRYWATVGNVDGFRFDLAAIFARTDDGAIDTDAPPIFSEIGGDPALCSVRLIGEPWDAVSAYLMGRSFPGRTWGQWNDHFRQTFRQIVKGDMGVIRDLPTRLYGSADLFPDDLADAYRRYQSVNYIDSHDGLKLCDLVSYTNDGQTSWNCGDDRIAGATAEVVALRRRQVKNFCCALMLSNGTPMFVAGDEFMNTEGGNPNPWNQDNETTWLDWSLLQSNAEIFRFFKGMIAFRKAHPSIGCSIGWRDDVTWYGVSGPPDFADWSLALAYHLRGGGVGDADLYVMINFYWEDLTFNVAPPGPWFRVADTALASPDDVVDGASAVPVGSAQYVVRGRSVAVLVNRRG